MMILTRKELKDFNNKIARSARFQNRLHCLALSLLHKADFTFKRSFECKRNCSFKTARYFIDSNKLLQLRIRRYAGTRPRNSIVVYI